PFYAGEEEDREQGRAVIREEVAPEYRVVRERPLGREDEEVSQEPDAQDAEHERDLRAPEPDEGPLDGHAQAEADDGIGIDVERPVRDLQDLRLPGEEDREKRRERH